MILRNLITICTLGDSGISKKSGTFTDCSQSDRSGDFGASGVGCEEHNFDTNKYLNIYFYPKNDTNYYPNIFVSKK